MTSLSEAGFDAANNGSAHNSMSRQTVQILNMMIPFSAGLAKEQFCHIWLPAAIDSMPVLRPVVVMAGLAALCQGTHIGNKQYAPVTGDRRSAKPPQA